MLCNFIGFYRMTAMILDSTNQGHGTNMHQKNKEEIIYMSSLKGNLCGKR